MSDDRTELLLDGFRNSGVKGIRVAEHELHLVAERPAVRVKGGVVCCSDSVVELQAWAAHVLDDPDV